jgi:hypothetical protein
MSNVTVNELTRVLQEVSEANDVGGSEVYIDVYETLRIETPANAPDICIDVNRQLDLIRPNT